MFSLQPSKNALARNIARIARHSVLFNHCILVQDLARSCEILESCNKILAQDLARYCRNAGERDLLLEYLAVLAIFLVKAFLSEAVKKNTDYHIIFWCFTGDDIQ